MSTAFLWGTVPTSINLISAARLTSPDSFIQTKWNASVVLQILAPPPVRRYEPAAESYSTEPCFGVSPTSAWASKAPRGERGVSCADTAQTNRKITDAVLMEAAVTSPGGLPWPSRW